MNWEPRQYNAMKLLDSEKVFEVNRKLALIEI